MWILRDRETQIVRWHIRKQNLSTAPMSKKISMKLTFFLNFFHNFYGMRICEISSLAIFPWSRLLNAACSTTIEASDDRITWFQIFANLQRTRCRASEVSKFWKNKQSCFLNRLTDGRIFFFHLTLFLLRETNLSSTFTKCLWFVPWVRLYWQQSFSSLQIEGRTYFTLLADRFFNLNKQNSSKVRTVSLSDTYQLYQAIGLEHERPSII